MHDRRRAAQTRAAFGPRAGDRGARLSGMRRRDFLFTLGAVAAPAWAQPAYPSKPITWVVGFPPGGGADGVTRLVSAKVSQNIGQPIVVENRPGASSIIAAHYVAQQIADGYTIFSA